jgi:spermidine synthase
MSPEQIDNGSKRIRLASLFFAAGGLALTIQVMLLRELMVALQGDEAALGLGLAAWLAGIAAGAGVARRLVRPRSESWVSIGFALLAFVGVLGGIASRLGRFVLAPPPGELLSLGPSAALAVIVLAPAGSLVGLTFTALATSARRAEWQPGQGIARLYVLESLGSLAGGLLVTFLVVPLLAPLKGLLLVAGIWILVGSPASTAMEETTVDARFRGLAPGIPLVAWTDTPYQHLAIGGDTPRHIYAGGQYAGSFPDPSEDEALAHQLASLAPRPASILVVGSGVLGALPYLLDHPVERIDFVEIDRRALGLVREFLPPSYRGALDDPRVRIVIDDPRRYLARSTERYDLILVLEPPPVTLLLARLSTVEFYRLCAAHLASDGVLAVSLETAPNVLTGETAALGGSLWGALREVFPVVRASPGPNGLLIAGTDRAAVTLDAATLAERFTSRGIVSDAFVPELFPILFPPERVAGQEAALERAAAGVSPSRDERPASFPHALARRQRVAGSLMAPLFGRAARASPAWLSLLALLPSLCVAGWLAIRRAGNRSLTLAAMHAVVVTGACGMAWSLLILFSYQTRAGALYGKIGLLAALFMLGLALGGRLLARGAELSAERVQRWLPAVTAAALAFALIMPGALLGLGHPALGRSGLPDILHGALLLAAGLITGCLFPVAAGVLLSGPRGARETASDLEAADHAGAAGAALLGGVLFIPLLGLSGTAWLLLALQAMAFLGVIVARAGRR